MFTTYRRILAKMRVICVALCLILQITQIALAKNFCIEGQRKGLKLSTTSVFRSQIHNTLYSCVKSCIATTSCGAFTYHQNDLRCFYGGTGAEFESTTDLHYISSPAQWTPTEHENLIYPCTRSCPNGSECFVMKNGSAICIITECTDRPSVGNSTFLSLERTVGHSVYPYCNEGYVLNGSPKVTCRGNGQWTDLDTTTCTECEDVVHYTSYTRAREYCLSIGKRLLQHGHQTPALKNVTKGRCVTCPGDLVADLQTRYLKHGCTPKYPTYVSCTCHFIAADPEVKIAITREYLALEKNYDFLYILDALDDTGRHPVLGNYTGIYNSPVTVYSSGPEAFIQMLSDGIITSDGFQLSYRIVSSDTTSTTRISYYGASPIFLWLDGYTYPNSFTYWCYNPDTDKVYWRDEGSFCNTYCETP